MSKENNRPDAVHQLQLELETGTSIHWPLADDHIGGQLLPTVSKGQYKDPRHSLREYIQNGVDGNAHKI